MSFSSLSDRRVALRSSPFGTALLIQGGLCFPTKRLHSWITPAVTSCSFRQQTPLRHHYSPGSCCVSSLRLGCCLFLVVFSEENEGGQNNKGCLISFLSACHALFAVQAPTPTGLDNAAQHRSWCLTCQLSIQKLYLMTSSISPTGPDQESCKQTLTLSSHYNSRCCLSHSLKVTQQSFTKHMRKFILRKSND